jgi:hypothetical protein
MTLAQLVTDDAIIIHCMQDGMRKVWGRVPAGSTDAKEIMKALAVQGTTFAWVHRRPEANVVPTTEQERAAMREMTKHLGEKHGKTNHA